MRLSLSSQTVTVKGGGVGTESKSLANIHSSRYYWALQKNCEVWRSQFSEEYQKVWSRKPCKTALKSVKTMFLTIVFLRAAQRCIRIYQRISTPKTISRQLSENVDTQSRQRAQLSKANIWRSKGSQWNLHQKCMKNLFRGK